VMAQGYALMIGNTIKTWEERAIHQSSVERVAWPDLFHVTVRAINVLNKTLKGLKVYPDNMYKEIIESRGVYASSEVKEFLKEHLVGGDLAHEDIYRIVQLAAFTAFKPNGKMLDIRETIPQYFMQAEEQIADLKECLKKENLANDIERVICYGKLEYTDDLDISLEQVIKYNKALKKLFDGNQWTLWDKWRELFTPSFLLKNEYILFQEILGV
jgi:adenylosuccinate lyase